MGVPKPDKVFYLELPAEEAKTRAVYGEERYEKVSFQEEVEKQYKMLMKSSGDEWRTLDASRSIDTLHKQILTESLEVADAIADLPISTLWTEEIEES